MPFTVEMPKLGLTMEEGTIVEWLKAQGDAVIQGEPLFWLETDKITLEAEAPESGILGQILVEAGATVATGSPVALILGAREEAEVPPVVAQAPKEEQPVVGPSAKAKVAPEAKAKATPVARRLAEKEGLDVGQIVGSGPGGRVTAKDVEAAVARAQEGAPAPRVPTPPQPPAETGQGVKASPRAREMAAPPASTPPPQPAKTVQGVKASPRAREMAAPPASTPPPQPAKTGQGVKASPRAREMAEAAGLDLAMVGGTGKDGRVMAGDVERALAAAGARSETVTAPQPAGPGQQAGPALLVESASEVIPLSGMRGVIARRMSASTQTAAAVTTMTQADATELVRQRDDLSQEWTALLGFGPSYNDLLLVILAKALAEFPYVNAHLVDEEIRQMASINVGLAVDTERGLIVPVIRGVQGMLLADVAAASRDLVQRARQGKLLPDDVSGGTFTLSNMGAFDVEASTPILNLPEVAILGVGRIALRPAAFGGELCLRQTVTLSLTYDHRAIDGAPAARFLARVKELVERPHLALVR